MCSFNPMLMLEYAKMTSKHEKKNVITTTTTSIIITNFFS